MGNLKINSEELRTYLNEVTEVHIENQQNKKLADGEIEIEIMVNNTKNADGGINLKIIGGGGGTQSEHTTKIKYKTKIYNHSGLEEFQKKGQEIAQKNIERAKSYSGL